MMTVDSIFSVLFQLFAFAVTATATGYGLFRFLAKNWIENEFNKELKRAETQLSIMAARQLKLHDREYIVFPEVWKKLNKAFSSLSQAITSPGRGIDLNKMSGEDLLRWINKSDLLESKKNKMEIANSEERNIVYYAIFFSNKLSKFSEEWEDFYDYFRQNSIFIRPNIKIHFEEISYLFIEITSLAVKDLKTDDFIVSDSVLVNGIKKYYNEVRPKMAEIEALVQQTIFPESHG